MPGPDTVDYIGRSVNKFNVVIGKATTDAKGAFSLNLTAPKDFGGIHDIYAVIDGKQVSHGGFLVSRTVTISPMKGPIGTPITITVTGLGSSQYESEAAVLYDNHFTGLIAGNTTRGTATVHIRAAGDMGRHEIEVYDASHVLPYLNIEESPLPWLMPVRVPVHADKGLRQSQAQRRDARDRPADRRRAHDAVGRARFFGGSRCREVERHERPDPDQGGDHRERAHAERARRPRVGDRRRQPGQLHRHVLVVRPGAAREGERRRRRVAVSVVHAFRTGSAAGTSSSSSRTGRSTRRCRTSSIAASSRSPRR